jgi:hypothetical protein
VTEHLFKLLWALLGTGRSQKGTVQRDVTGANRRGGPDPIGAGGGRMSAAKDVREPCAENRMHDSMGGARTGVWPGSRDLRARRKRRGSAPGPAAVRRHRASSLPDLQLGYSCIG